jgi:translation initiation factor IF-3
MTHRELGAKILARLTQELADIADVEVAPKMEGYQMFTIFLPKKVTPEKKKKQPGHTTDQPNAEPEKKREPKAEKPAAAPTAPAKDPDEIF